VSKKLETKQKNIKTIKGEVRKGRRLGKTRWLSKLWERKVRKKAALGLRNKDIYDPCSHWSED